jgi:cob(I)alamin adenosyltransferase
MVHLYIGDGKGKTTAALGLALRASGWGRRVYIAQFIKDSGFASGEIKALAKTKITIERFKNQLHPMFAEGKKLDPGQLRQSMAESLDRVEGLLTGAKFDLIVLDEILNALEAKLFAPERLKRIVRRAGDIELVLTGRRASDEIKQAADYISVITKAKHPFDKKILAREGIEF